FACAPLVKSVTNTLFPVTAPAANGNATTITTVTMMTVSCVLENGPKPPCCRLVSFTDFRGRRPGIVVVPTCDPSFPSRAGFLAPQRRILPHQDRICERRRQYQLPSATRAARPAPDRA